jgi:transposase
LGAKSHQALLWQAGEGAGKLTGTTYIAFLEQLLEPFSSPLILIEEGAPYHRSKEVKQFQATHAQRLSVYPLPAFSPDFNPIEKLWKNTKKDATHLRYFKTLAQSEPPC